MIPLKTQRDTTLAIGELFMRDHARAAWEELIKDHPEGDDASLPDPDIAGVSTTYFDSTVARVSDQFEYWRSVVADTGKLERPDKLYDQEFSGRSTNFYTSSILYARHSMETISEVDRSERYADNMSIDALAIQLRLSGVELENSLKTDRLFEPGDIRILDLSQPFCSSALHYDNLAIVIGKKELQDRLPGLEQLHGVTLAQTPMTQFLRAHFHSVMEFIPQANQVEAEKAADASIEMLRASLMQSVDPNVLEGDAMIAPVMRAVRMYVRDHLHKTNLAPEEIARAVGVSRAKLFRICKTYGTPMELVRHQRMRRAKELLKTREVQSVEEVAFRVGYENSTSFSRAFKREFGFLPSELL